MTIRLKDMGMNASRGGDSSLVMNVFEAERTWRDVDGKRRYSGGSGGAYEILAREQAGALVCIMNPKVKRPFCSFVMNGEVKSKEEVANTLCLAPLSDGNILIVGYSSDVTGCQALKMDGTKCASVVDKRDDRDVCEYHRNLALQRGLNSRQEFANSSTSFGVQKPRRFDQQNMAFSGSTSTPYISQGSLRKESDPASSLYSIRDRYGREREEKLMRERKREAEEVAACHLKPSGRRRNVSKETFTDMSSEMNLEDHNKANSVGGRAILDAKEKMEGGIGSSRKRQKKEKGECSGKRYTYGAEAIKKIGFDPLAGTKKQPGSAAAGRVSDSQASNPILLAHLQCLQLLARHGATPGLLPEAMLRGKAAPKPNVRPPKKSPSPDHHSDSNSDLEFV